MSVKVKFSKKFKDLMKGDLLKKALTTKNMSIIGKEAVNIIWKRTKDGKGLTENSSGGNLKPLDKLSPSYKEFRKGKVAFFTAPQGHVYPSHKNITKPQLGIHGTPTKSNLTFSGEMLDSLEYKATKDKATIDVTGARNKKVAGYVVEGGRPWLGLAKKEIKLLTAKFREIMREIVSRFN
jgi:hypothetical protein